MPTARRAGRYTGVDHKDEEIRKLRERVEKLQVQVRHLRNENKVYQSENISTSRSYYDMADAAQRSRRRNDELAEQLRQSQKLEALGLLAGGVAHDFNNLLTIIQGNVELLSYIIADEQRSGRHLRQIEKASQRAKRLTQQLLAFSRRQVMQPQVLNLNELITDFAAMLERVVPESIEFRLHLDEHLGNVKVDPSQIEQVILNLVVNACDAMPEGGMLSLHTTNIDIGEDYTLSHINVQKGCYVLMEISDTGMGMDKDTQQKIFEPFFTTKETGKGTGLGLATVYGIVTQSSGHIWVYSEPDEGTVFKIYLPRVEEAVIRADTIAAVDDLTGRETILVVEDEDDLREMLCESLEACNYQVLQAANGEEGLKRFEEHGGHVHLTISDLIMPKLSGKEMAEALLARQPDMKVMFMSGYSDEMISYKGFLLPETDFMQKPFKIQEMLQRVKIILTK